jgi:molecular chaperone GrpE
MNELRKYATEVLLKDMLSVLDNLDRAVETGSKPDTDKQALLEGVKMIQNEVLRILEKHGVQPFDSQGEPFNPTFHEAMMQEETEDYAENTITNELQKGYMIHDRLLRPAMVVVAKASSDSENNHNNEDIEK